MTLTNNPQIDYKNFLKIAQTGHYPLFFGEWLNQSFNQAQGVTIRKASHNVKHVFNQLSRHNTIEKKKTALIGMDRLSREEFIRSFFKVVEYEILKENTKLQ
jgi:hypothetical protein